MRTTSLIADLPPPPPDRSGWPWTEDTPPKSYDRHADWPRITLVTPSFNQAGFLEETIRSVLLQNYPNLQYIVIDGGSTDQSVEIIRRYEPWLDHWASEPDRGQSHAINKGLQLADGHWFNWLNSDDLLLPGALCALAERARMPGVRIVAGRTRTEQEGRSVAEYGATLGGLWPASLFQLGVNQPGSLLHLDSVRQIGELREDLHLVMDLDLWLRTMLTAGENSLQRIPQPVAVYRLHPKSKTCAGEDVFALEEFALLVDLASSAGAALPACILQIRAECPVPVRRFEVFAQLPADVAHDALCQRLIVNDSLLYRAIRHLEQDSKTALARFRACLHDWSPWPPPSRLVQARALLHALQREGRPDAATAWQICCLAPSPRHLLALAKLAFTRL